MKKLLFSVLIYSLFITSCDENSGGPEESGYDRQPYLTAYADNYIVPKYSSYLDKVSNLMVLAEQYKQESTDLGTLRASMLEAWKEWQYVAFLDFGPASDKGLLAQSNTYPTNTDRIEANISKDSYKLSAVSNYTAKGYPALDYLLFTKEEHTQSEKEYIYELSKDLYQLTEATSKAWEDYRDIFVEADGNDVGSSLGLMINSFNQYLERDFRNGKLAIPLGWKTGGTVMPSHTEAYYSGASNVLLVEGSKALKAFFMNNNDGTSSKSLQDMIAAVGTRFQSGNLPESVEADLDVMIEESAELKNPVAESLISDYYAVDEAFVASKKLVVQFKSNIPSALGVMITYQDNDGD